MSLSLSSARNQFPWTSRARRNREGEGSFRLVNEKEKTHEIAEANAIGVLQTAKDWASFTAIARMRPSLEPAAVTVVVEHADPFVDGRPRTVTVKVQGRAVLSGVLR